VRRAIPTAVARVPQVSRFGGETPRRAALRAEAAPAQGRPTLNQHVIQADVLVGRGGAYDREGGARRGGLEVQTARLGLIAWRGGLKGPHVV
jgi:hypothetical protein